MHLNVQLRHALLIVAYFSSHSLHFIMLQTSQKKASENFSALDTKQTKEI
jgi:hypothetical protein